MKIFVGIDDSRQLDGYKAGETASLLCQAIDGNSWGKSAIPSRHRLYFHTDIACKKHNTARCFSADLKEQYLEEFIEYSCKMIKSNLSPDCNTGLAIAVPELMENTDDLIEYAYRVKEGIVSKDEALKFAKKPGLYLFELSGSGKGIIGALAAAGLRSTGNDGQFRGKLKLGTEEYYIASVREIIEKTYVEQVKNMDFENLDDGENVRMGEKVKVVLLDNQYTLMVFPTDIEHPKWQTSTTHMLRMF
jgi:tRNA(Ile2) C34 agmatinyltransferase TiaS